MELLERDSYISELVDRYENAGQGNGHTLFLMGEAGIGKTSLVNHFLKNVQRTAMVLSGSCDSFFTPRPLGPLFDIAAQIGSDFMDLLRHEKERSIIFSSLFQKISSYEKPVVLVFEDIHWADEATIDLVKFLGRRIYRTRCLFLLTYRDNEIEAQHPMTTIFGELPPGHFSKTALHRFSKETVNRLAIEKGYSSGEKVFSLTGGNPFYVSEIFERYSAGIPERVKDSILTVFKTRPDDTKALWEFFSILPTSRIELSIAKRIEKEFADCIDRCLSYGVIVSKPGYLSFKHELFRMAVEESIPQAKKKVLHKKMLSIMLEVAAEANNLPQLVHHARHADEREMVIRLAPQAAREAAAVGSHIEASKLYATAIEFTDQDDPSRVAFLEKHAYECYLTNQITAGITSLQAALDIWKARKVSLKEGDTLRFLSRLWWFEGDHEKAMVLGLQAIDVLENGFPTRERVLAYSNYSQLCMLLDDFDKALLWGNKAIELAVKMEDHEILSHALNNVGSVLLKSPATEREGEDNLNRSLAIALEHGFHEHVARAYVNLFATFVLIRQFEKASAIVDVGLKYCEERELNSWMYHLLGWKARLLFDLGKWDEAESISKQLQNNSSTARIGTLTILARLSMRRGKFEEAKKLLADAKVIAMPTREVQRIVPVLIAELELSWINGELVSFEEIREFEKVLKEKNNAWYYSELTYWMTKCEIPLQDEHTDLFVGPFKRDTKNGHDVVQAWRNIGCPYEEALALFNLETEDQKHALTILESLGASATVEILREKLKLMGVKNIPRGPRESTRSNPAQLTNRQIDVLNLLKDGLQNAQIAEKLFISTKTVDHHIASIFVKLNVNTRTKAVSEARKLRILV